MTSLDEPLAAEATEFVPVLPATRSGRLEELLARLSERLNPILVKEARQALHSRQFITTFLFMLAAAWCWSILGLTLMGPGIGCSTDGPAMFSIYHLILAFPLLIVANVRRVSIAVVGAPGPHLRVGLDHHAHRSGKSSAASCAASSCK